MFQCNFFGKTIFLWRPEKENTVFRAVVYFLKLGELVEKPLAKCLACQIVRKKHQHPTLKSTPTHKKTMETANIDFLGPSQMSSIPYFLICQF